MKNLIFTAAAVLAFGFANAQSQDDSAKTFGFAENDIFVEGNLGFTSTDNKNTNAKTNSVQFSPKVSYFISDNVAIGVQVGVGSAKGELNGVDVSKSSSFNAGVFGRYYFLELGKRFKTYGSANIDFGSAKSGLGNAEVKSNGTAVGVGLGLNYFVTERIVLNFGLRNILSYNTSKVDAPGAKSSSNFGFDLNGNVANPFAAGSFGVGYRF